MKRNQCLMCETITLVDSDIYKCSKCSKTYDFVEMQGIAIEIVCDSLNKIIETGEKKGIFGYEGLEKIALFLHKHSRKN